MRMGLLSVAMILCTSVASVAAEPPIVFQTQAPGRVLDDVRAIAKMAGGDKAVAEFNEAIKEKLGEKGFEGLDLNRAIVGYVLIDAKLENTTGVIAVPITTEKEFLGLYERILDEKLKAGEGGIYEIPLPNADAPVKVSMKFEGQYAYFAIGKDPTAALKPKALVPAEKLFNPEDKSFASVKVHFDRLPKELRAEISSGLKELKNKLADLKLPEEASEPARKAVDEMIKLGERYAELLLDAETASVRVILDFQSGEAGLELGLTGKPGSNLAKSIAARKPSTNKFAGLITPDTIAGIKLQLPLFAKEIQNAAVIGLEAGQKQAQDNAPPQFKAAIDEAFKGLVRTVKDGEFDFAMSLRGPDKDGLYTVVGAVAFEDPSALEKELRALFKTEVPPMIKGVFNLDVATVGKTSIHQAKIGGVLPPEVQKVFGEEASVTFAFAPNGIFVAFGPDAINTMKTALTVKKAPSPVLETLSNPMQIRKFAAALGKEFPDGIGTHDKLMSSFAISIEGGKELRLKFFTNLKGIEGIGNLGFTSVGSAKPIAPKLAK